MQDFPYQDTSGVKIYEPGDYHQEEDREEDRRGVMTRSMKRLQEEENGGWSLVNAGKKCWNAGKKLVGFGGQGETMDAGKMEEEDQADIGAQQEEELTMEAMFQSVQDIRKPDEVTVR